MTALGAGNFPTPMAMAWAMLFPAQGAFHADAVVAKTNLRAFYLSDGLTLKFSGAAGPIRNEIAVRRAIVDTAHVRVPRIARSFDGDEPYIFENLVRGSRPAERDVTQGFVQKLWAFHLANGMKSEVLSSVIDPEQLDTALHAALQGFPERAPQIMQGWLALKREIDWASRVPVGLTHGDMAVSNILVDDAGNLVLLDWEQGAQRVVLDDFAKLALRFPSILTPLRGSYANWLGEPAPDLRPLITLCLLNRFACVWQTPEGAANVKLQGRRLDLAERALGETWET